jgi:hypothetical protein
MNVFEFVLAVLALWRVTHLISAEDGPFNAIARLRKAAGRGFWGSLLDCFYCLSLWIAIPLALWLGSSWKQRVIVWLALSAAAILINRIADRIAPDAPIYFEEPETNKKEIQ